MIATFWFLLGLLCAIPVYSQVPSASPPLTMATLQTHQRYLANHLQQGQFAAIDSLLATLDREPREFLLLFLLHEVSVVEPASAPLQAWVKEQADKAPQWLVEQQIDDFLVQQPAYDFAAQARLLLSQWQLQHWQQHYYQQLQQGHFHFKSLYFLGNPDIVRQQQGLLLALEQLPTAILTREARALAALNIYLPDNQLLRALLERTGEPALYTKLWHQQADPDGLAALATVSRFHQGATASELLIAASENPELKGAALRQLSALNPLPPQAQRYLLTELSNRQYGAVVADLLMAVNEPRLLSGLVQQVGRGGVPAASALKLPVNPSVADVAPQQ
ncbi:MAG: hypothetical protein ACRC5V_08725 [Aeromonas sp.]